MQFRFFMIPALHPDEAERQLNSFCAAKRIAGVEKHLVADGQQSFWTVCVSYIEGVGAASAEPGRKVDYREVLNDRDFALFAKLRNLRKTLAEQEGIPAYALFTNEQLAEMVRSRAVSLTALRAIDGVGKSRMEKYGDRFLDLLRQEIGGAGVSEEARSAGETIQD